jgi:hypothetical protein
MRIPLPRLPTEMQWLKTFQVAARSRVNAFHYRKAANLRACGQPGSGSFSTERRRAAGVS